VDVFAREFLTVVALEAGLDIGFPSEHIFVSGMGRMAVETDVDALEILAGTSSDMHGRKLIAVVTVKTNANTALHFTVVLVAGATVSIFVRRVQIGVYKNTTRLRRAMRIVASGTVFTRKGISTMRIGHFDC
jgi:hypothetical protein